MATPARFLLQQEGDIITSQKITWRRNCAISFFTPLILVGAILASPDTPGSSDTLVLANGRQIVRVTPSIPFPRSMVRMSRGLSEEAIRQRVDVLLDSLGYMCREWHTDSSLGAIVSAGPRTQVDTVLVQCAVPLNIDSISSFSFPRPYDAAELSYLSQRTIEFLAQRGFPYARLSLDMGTMADFGCGHDPKGLTPVLMVDPQTQCLFGEALFRGDIKTNRKVLARDIVFSPGELFDYDKLEETRRNLLSRAYVSRVTLGTPALAMGTTGSINPKSAKSGTQLPRVLVPLGIEDKSGLGVDGAVAFQSDAPKSQRLTGLFSLNLLNMFGFGESAMFYYEGENEFQLLDIKASYPHLLGHPLFASAGFGIEISQNKYGYLAGMLEVLAELRVQWQAGVSLAIHETTDSLSQSSRFYGLDLVLKRASRERAAGVLTREINLRTGSGVSDRTVGRFYRWRLEFDAALHVPLFSRQAFVGRLVTKTMSIDKADKLLDVEYFRVGGQGSIRGYSEKEFGFRSVGYLQSEYHLYFSETGSAFIFADAGAGFRDDLTVSSSGRTDLFGYGLGIRVPVRVGTASIAWARNYRDTRGFGRLHVRIQNNISGGLR